MSTEAMTAVFRHSASTGAARLVLLAMADEASSDGHLTAYRRSQAWLASKANCDARTVRRAIDTLVDLGEVTVLSSGSGRDRSDYMLNLAGLRVMDEGGRDALTPDRGRARRPDPGRATCPPREGESPSPSPPSSPLTTPTTTNARGQLTMVPASSSATQNMAGSDRDPFWRAFWESYPRRTGKGQARTAWARCRRRGVAPEVMIRGAQRYAADPNREDQFTKHPATWLNGECWDDEPLPDRAPRGSAGTTMAAFRQVLANVGPDGNLPIAAVGAAVAPAARAAVRAAISAEEAAAREAILETVGPAEEDAVAAAWRAVAP